METFENTAKETSWITSTEGNSAVKVRSLCMSSKHEIATTYIAVI